MKKDKSMIQVAYEIMKKKKRPITFNNLWKEICKVLELTSEEADEKIAVFYTELTMDGQVIQLSKGWDLRERHSYKEGQHIDMSEAYGEEVESESEKENDSEEAKEDDDRDAYEDDDEDDDEDNERGEKDEDY